MVPTPRSALCFLVPALLSPLAAQATHTQLFPAVSPSPRAGLHGVTDGGGVLLFGGLTNGSPLAFSNETWRFDGTAWTNITPATSPPARDWYASAYDAGRGRYVLFGGRVLSGTVGVDAGDTWEFDGAAWTQVLPPASPSARRWSSMVYDLNLGKCVLYGGSTGGTVFLGDTWTWDGATWTQLAPAVSPSPRARGWLEWDYARSRAIYFGGKNTTANLALSETWSWNGATWSQITTTVQPGWNAGNGLIAFGMTYDLLRDRIVVTGGTRTTAGVSPQTYEFTGTDWVLHNTGGLPGRTGNCVVFVPGTGKTYVFGGSSGSAPLGDTWEYQTDDWAAYTPIGTGCAGPAGVVTLTNANLPWLGETHHTTVGNLDPLGLCFALIGLSTTAWTGGALPFPLLFVYPQTSPSCQLLVSTDSSVFLPNLGGTADLAVGLPNNTGFLGLALHLQAAQLDAAFNLSVSGGATLTLGAK